jgi:hypothetical protein
MPMHMLAHQMFMQRPGTKAFKGQEPFQKDGWYCGYWVDKQDDMLHKYFGNRSPAQSDTNGNGQIDSNGNGQIPSNGPQMLVDAYGSQIDSAPQTQSQLKFTTSGPHGYGSLEFSRWPVRCVRRQLVGHWDRV